MGTVDLRGLDGDQIVIHYGGALTSVDAYTFANSLISFADTIRAVNASINPGQNIEIRLEAVGPGSFRAVIKRVRKGLGGFFSRGAEALLWSIVGSLIYGHLIEKDRSVQIEITAEEVIIQRGDDRIVVSREAYDQMQAARENPEVQKHLSETFAIIERDDAIENFGVTKKIDDPKPLIQIDRRDFARMASPPEVTPDDPKRKERREPARLVILKPWLRTGKRKWSFEWNGVPISAPITDDVFWSKLERREILIGVGDAIDVTLKYQQDYDTNLNVYVNDNHTFEVIEVNSFIPRDGAQASIFDSR